MITFFGDERVLYAVESDGHPGKDDLEKLTWLFGGATCIAEPVYSGTFTGPRREMVTPWSTNAVEITQNMGIRGIRRIERFTKYEVRSTKYDQGVSPVTGHAAHVTTIDPMLEAVYNSLDQDLFHIEHTPDAVRHISDIAAYNASEGLALSAEEVEYLVEVSKKIGRPLTDSEVFGFSQVNSEHCRHKIFNGTFIIDGHEMTDSLFALIRKTSRENSNFLVSAYKDNVAFIQGPEIEQFAPGNPQQADFFTIRDIRSVISLKAETHNFPTTVEPFNGAATGSGGEIRDRMAGGKGSIPLAGTAVYMTSYPRPDGGRTWEKFIPPRPWLYKTPGEILLKASNGASDFGNKFGQALICGSLLTFEYAGEGRIYGYDKVIMLAGGIGYARQEDALKEEPQTGQPIVVMGGDNYRIGMGGGAVSSVATGEYGNAIELNAVQRSNPEMQKRVFNAIRAMTEMEKNPIVSIHDHGAGGHLNSLSELVENTGGTVYLDRLPVGDPTLSAREVASNESQERMGLVIGEENLEILEQVAERERAPLYVAGMTAGDHRLIFEDQRNGVRPIDLSLEDFFGKPPKTVINDDSRLTAHGSLHYQAEKIFEYLDQVLQLEAVACKDWLTNKVDRAVSGRIAKQQTCGAIQLPLNNLGVTALDYRGQKGIATSLGHAPAVALVDPGAGSRMAVARALTNLVWAPLTHGLKGVSLSANWMWPCRNAGEDARLYTAVKALSDFAIALGINVPTGKDSLSMTQKYPGGDPVLSPGTVIVSAVAEVEDVKKVISPALANIPGSILLYIPFGDAGFELGGSSFAQTLGQVGNTVPDISDPALFSSAFAGIQAMVAEGLILAGHDVAAGGLITTLLEMAFPVEGVGIKVEIDPDRVGGPRQGGDTPTGWGDPVRVLFSEQPGVVVQVREGEMAKWRMNENGCIIGKVTPDRSLNVSVAGNSYFFDIDSLRDTWFHSSYLMDRLQSGEALALERLKNYGKQPLKLVFSTGFTGKAASYGIDMNRRIPSGIKAAVIREKGVNRDRDMAWALYLAGFDVKDIHMTDLVAGREDLSDVNFIAFAGGFSNSDVLGSAKGWAGAFRYNEKARAALERFFARPDTLSLGVCNGCQLLVELGLIYPEYERHPWMSWNDSHKYECSFVSVDIVDNHSVMLHSLAGSRLGIWVAHGEGKFNFPEGEERYHIPVRFSYHAYPGNPNGSQFDAACIASADGRHLAIMPHLEDSVLPWQWPFYPPHREDEITPWMEAFTNARKWILDTLKIKDQKSKIKD
ncbi:MAG TPA: phosphoribosylformylglycinamidine synthase [Bacteroidales bacterium]|mgnify:CR=1 FL=1|nr:phosphoribosylformylglycinamidine synthase [Bacteroidales bacterium]HPS61555.1 phosphoribosylformylglycinamidine synthase [Bacteroidales bacterium]